MAEPEGMRYDVVQGVEVWNGAADDGEPFLVVKLTFEDGDRSFAIHNKHATVLGGFLVEHAAKIPVDVNHMPTDQHGRPYNPATGRYLTADGYDTADVFEGATPWITPEGLDDIVRQVQQQYETD